MINKIDNLNHLDKLDDQSNPKLSLKNAKNGRSVLLGTLQVDDAKCGQYITRVLDTALIFYFSWLKTLFPTTIYLNTHEMFEMQGYANTKLAFLAHDFLRTHI